MSDNQLDWSAAYVVPSRLRFRLTPAGNLRAEQERPHGLAEAAEMPEVEAAHVELLLAFSSPREVAAAFAQAAATWDLDRLSYGRLVESWVGLGLLRRAEAGAHATTRLALFAEAMAEHAATGAPGFPLRSHFSQQQPGMFYPGLATREVHDAERFAWVAVLEDAFDVIRAELDGLLASADLSRVNPTYTSQGEWAAAYLWAFGEKVEEVCRRCPETTRLLAAIPGVAQFGTTLFSALAPHSRIAPHHGVTNAKLRCQLPLRVPPGCKLKVGDHEIEQREGRCIVFDDSFLHSAWNESDQPRFVLVFDFFHPDLTSAEVAFLSRLPSKESMARHHLGQAAAGAKAAWARAHPER